MCVYAETFGEIIDKWRLFENNDTGTLTDMSERVNLMICVCAR